MPTSPPTPKLKKELATFLVLTFALSSVFYYIIGSAGTLDLGGGRYVFMLMWCPGVSALVTRLIFQHDVRGEGWRWGEHRYALLAYALPIAYASVAYGTVWLTGLGAVDPSRFHSNVLRFLLLGMVLSVSSALGEELGWRGFLVPKLAEGYSFTRAAFTSGIIWSAWHVPLIILADYNGGTPTWYSIACFAVMVVGISFPFAWIRLRSKSLWPAAILHASHNLFIQGFFDRVTVDTGHTKYFVSEFGAALAVTAVVTGYIFWRLRTRLAS
ncbi:MAG: CPBP family intramembrane metalloprotease [Gemmatimonadaceae bacterium]|nr:CPBP family intramembrane metalloprotease [Gemmatimonadaceae bacterium]